MPCSRACLCGSLENPHEFFMEGYTMSKTALVLVADGSEEIETVTAGDVLHRFGIDVTYAGVGTMEPRGAHATPMRASMLVDDIGGITFDAIIIPGGSRGSENIAHSDMAKEIIQRHWNEGKIVGAICAAPALVLGPMGLLDDKFCTCFPGMERRFPKTAKHRSGHVVVDGKLVTSRAPGTAIEFALKIGEMLVDEAAARKVGETMYFHMV